MARSILLVIMLLANHAWCQTYHQFNDPDWSWHTDVKIGITSIRGYSFNVGYGVSKKSNNFEISAGLDSQVGNVKQGFIFPVRYNDKFYHIDLAYGRIFQYKRLVCTLSVGPDFYFYKDKSLSNYHTSYFIDYNTISVDRKGIGFTGKSAVLLLIGDKNLLGIEGCLYYTPVITISNLGVSWKILF